jgi:hypothetical protein
MGRRARRGRRPPRAERRAANQAERTQRVAANQAERTQRVTAGQERRTTRAAGAAERRDIRQTAAAERAELAPVRAGGAGGGGIGPVDVGGALRNVGGALSQAFDEVAGRVGGIGGGGGAGGEVQVSAQERQGFPWLLVGGAVAAVGVVYYVQTQDTKPKARR